MERSYEGVISIPRELRLAEHVFALKLDHIDLSFVDVCTFDFRNCEFGEPLPILLLADKIKRLAGNFGGTCKFRLLPGKTAFSSFADHVGLFRYMGWARGREPGEAYGSTGYLPIETFDILDFKRKAGKGPIGELINDEATRMAVVLSQTDEGSTFDVLQYAIREIMRNAAEHSDGTRATIMAQYWPTRYEAEIVVIDNGVGIPNNLYENEYVDCNNARQALKFALLPGISGVSLEKRINQDEFWGNSGFGLFVTSRICAENGLFRLISDRQGLSLVGDRQIEHDWVHHGTCVQMRLRTRKSTAIQADIPRLIEEGENQRAALMRHYPIQASAASKMLASQYRRMNVYRN